MPPPGGSAPLPDGRRRRGIGGWLGSIAAVGIASDHDGSGAAGAVSRHDEDASGDVVDVSVLDTIEVALADVGAALERLSDGRYGSCETCDRTIDDDVLRADPTARRCPEHLPLVAVPSPPAPGAGPTG